MNIKIGRAYRAKKPAIANDGFVNDRQVLWIDRLGTLVQYDSPSVSFGRKHPCVSMEAFIKWADRDVTDELPKGEWAAYTRGIK